MEINENTMLVDILDKYPWIRDELPKIDKKFRMLKTPLGKVMVRNADITEMSRRSGLSIEDIISMINKIINSRE